MTNPETPKQELPQNLDWQAQALQLASQGVGVSEISRRINKPIGTISPYLSRERSKQIATQQGAQLGAQAASQPQEAARGLSPARAPSEEERARRYAIRLLSKAQRGQSVSKDRLDAAKALLAKIKASGETDEDQNRTAYATMQDEEIADHVVSAAVKVLGIQRLRDTLMRLEKEGVLEETPNQP